MQYLREYSMSLLTYISHENRVASGHQTSSATDPEASLRVEKSREKTKGPQIVFGLLGAYQPIK